jgi:hypothetical protein
MSPAYTFRELPHDLIKTRSNDLLCLHLFAAHAFAWYVSRPKIRDWRLGRSLAGKSWNAEAENLIGLSSKG